MQLPSDLSSWSLDTIRELVDAVEFEPLEFDYKAVLSMPGSGASAHNDSIRRTVCAMANTGGGFIIFGVQDRANRVADPKDRIIGIPPGDLFKEFGEKIQVLQPNVPIEAMPRPIRLSAQSPNGVWVVRVPASPLRPHMFNGSFPKRATGGFAKLMDLYEVREQMLFNEERMRKLTLFRLEIALSRDLTQTLLDMGDTISRSMLRFDTTSFKVLLAEVVSILPGGNSFLMTLLQISVISNLINQFLDQATFPGMRVMVTSEDVGRSPNTALAGNAQLLKGLCDEVASTLDEVFGPLATERTADDGTSAVAPISPEEMGPSDNSARE